jgi:hypothetical protein
MVTATGAAVTAMAGSAGATQSNPNAVDVVFVVDRSGNGESLGNALGDELPRFADAMEERDIDARYGLVTYESDATTETALTSDIGAVGDGLSAVTYDGSFENASEGVTVGDGMSFRPGAERVYVVLTNEDDSSPETVRTAADETLSADGTTMFAAGPDSWELRASEVGGTWYDIPSAFDNETADVAGAVDALETTVAAAVEDRRAQQRRRQTAHADIDITNVSISESSTVTGSPVEIAVTVRNDGGAGGMFYPQLRSDGEIIAGNGQTNTIPAKSERTYRFTHTFDDPGTEVLSLGHRYIGKIRVGEPGPPGVTATPDGDGVDVQVSNATVDRPVDVALPPGGFAIETGVRFDRLGVQATQYGDVELALSQPPTLVERLSTLDRSAGARPLSAVTVEGEPGGVRNLTVRFRVDRTEHPDLRGSSVFVSRIGERGETTRIEATRTNTTEEAFVYRFDAGDRLPATYAVMSGTPSVTVESAELSTNRLRTGQFGTVSATVRNEGSGGTTYAVPLHVNGEFTGIRIVELPAGASRTVTFTVFPGDVGQQRITVGSVDAGTVMSGSEMLPADERQASRGGA